MSIYIYLFSSLALFHPHVCLSYGVNSRIYLWIIMEFLFTLWARYKLCVYTNKMLDGVQ